MIGQLKEILASVNPDLNLNGVTSSTRIREDLGIDSVNMMLLAIAIEDTFDFRFDDMPQFTTVGDICDYIVEKTGVNGVQL